MKNNSTSYDFGAAGRRGAAARKRVGGGWPKGRRQHALGISPRAYHSLLAEIMSAVREPVPGERSVRVVAAHCGVSARTVGRWLDGTDWPPASMVRRLQAWIKIAA